MNTQSDNRLATSNIPIRQWVTRITFCAAIVTVECYAKLCPASGQRWSDTELLVAKMNSGEDCQQSRCC
ncbi:unnamed protein product, partial [Brenthis ino]